MQTACTTGMFKVEADTSAMGAEGLMGPTLLPGIILLMPSVVGFVLLFCCYAPKISARETGTVQETTPAKSHQIIVLITFHVRSKHMNLGLFILRHNFASYPQW